MSSMIPIHVFVSFLIFLKVFKHECVALVKMIVHKVKNMIVNCQEKLESAIVEWTGS